MNRKEYLFMGFLWFSLLFYAVALFYGGQQKFREITPWFLLVVRDIIFSGLLFYFIYEFKTALPKQLIGENYRKFLTGFFILAISYLAVILIHLSHKGFWEIAHHDLRNILFYSLFLPFLPSILETKKSIDNLVSNILYAGVVLSVFGIITRFTESNHLTWTGRIISTMGDPNNLAIFLFLCILIVLARWNWIGKTKVVFFLSVYLYAFVLTSSVTAFATANFGVFIVCLLKNGKLKGTLYSALILYAMISMSLISKYIDNPNDDIQHIANFALDEDRYLIDKLNIISKGKFSEIFLFGTKARISDRILQRFQEGGLRTYNKRREQLKLTTSEDTSPLKKIRNVLFGDFNLIAYQKTDFQYLNLFYNSGVIGVAIFLYFFAWVTVTGLKYWGKYKDTVILSFAVFILSMLLIGFNGGAFLNRFPINFLLYLSAGIIFLKKDIESISHEN